MINNFLSSALWLSSSTICPRKAASKLDSFPLFYRVLKWCPGNFERGTDWFCGFSCLEDHPGLMEYLSPVWLQSSVAVLCDSQTTPSLTRASFWLHPPFPCFLACRHVPLWKFPALDLGSALYLSTRFPVVGKVCKRSQSEHQGYSLLPGCLYSWSFSKYRARKCFLLKDKEWVYIDTSYLSWRLYSLCLNSLNIPPDLISWKLWLLEYTCKGFKYQFKYFPLWMYGPKTEL